jgi:hypothetical protein
MRDLAGKIRSEESADRRTQGKHGHRHRPPVRWKIIRHDGCRGRRAPGFAYAYADAPE